ncbi:MAG: hypothetical protein WCT53_05095 [Candidatus Gracilibacteria bacterium]
MKNVFLKNWIADDYGKFVFVAGKEAPAVPAKVEKAETGTVLEGEGADAEPSAAELAAKRREAEEARRAAEAAHAAAEAEERAEADRSLPAKLEKATGETSEGADVATAVKTEKPADKKAPSVEPKEKIAPASTEKADEKSSERKGDIESDEDDGPEEEGKKEKGKEEEKPTAEEAKDTVVEAAKSGGFMAMLEKLIEKFGKLFEQIGNWLSEKFDGMTPKFKKSPIGGSEKFTISTAEKGVDLKTKKPGLDATWVKDSEAKVVDVGADYVKVGNAEGIVTYSKIKPDVTIGAVVKPGAKLGAIDGDTLNLQMEDKDGKSEDPTSLLRGFVDKTETPDDKFPEFSADAPPMELSGDNKLTIEEIGADQKLKINAGKKTDVRMISEGTIKSVAENGTVTISCKGKTEIIITGLNSASILAKKGEVKKAGARIGTSPDGVFTIQILKDGVPQDPYAMGMTDYLPAKEAASEATPPPAAETPAPAPTEGEKTEIDIPELKLELKDVPNDTPKNFNKVLVENIQSTKDGLVAYLKTYRQKAVEQWTGRMSKFKDDLLLEVDKFIANINRSADDMIEVARRNNNRPIEEQKRILAAGFTQLFNVLAENYGVMQSFVQFKLKAAYKSIDQKIAKPLDVFLLQDRVPTAPAAPTVTPPPAPAPALEAAPQKASLEQHRLELIEDNLKDYIGKSTPISATSEFNVKLPFIENGQIVEVPCVIKGGNKVEVGGIKYDLELPAGAELTGVEIPELNLQDGTAILTASKFMFSDTAEMPLSKMLEMLDALRKGPSTLPVKIGDKSATFKKTA